MLRSWHVMMAIGACSCSGVTTTDIPGGFSTAHRFDNAAQIRISQSGLAALEQDFALLLGGSQGNLAFQIPSTCKSKEKLCCNNQCTARVTLQDVALSAVSPNQLQLSTHAQVRTDEIKYRRKIKILGWVGCDVRYDSTRNGDKTVELSSRIDLGLDADRNLVFSQSDAQLKNFSCNDVKISGGGECKLAGWVCDLFKDTIKRELEQTIGKAIGDAVSSQPTAAHGRATLTELLGLRVHQPALLDFGLWAGGYADAEANGLSLGVLGGSEPGSSGACVPDCEVPGAACRPPLDAPIPRSAALRRNTRATGEAFEVAVGIHRHGLERAAYALHRSGGLCLEAGHNSVAQLTSDLVTLAIPSLDALTGGKRVPLRLSLRPQRPPRIEFGAGTFHITGQSSADQGVVVIDEPLIRVMFDEFAVEVYAAIEHRFVRLMTVLGRLTIPLVLQANGTGTIRPRTDLTGALTQVRVEQSALLRESPQELATVFETLFQLAAPALAEKLDTIDLPDLQGLQLVLDQDGVTTLHANKVLAVFLRLAPASN